MTKMIASGSSTSPLNIFLSIVPFPQTTHFAWLRLRWSLLVRRVFAVGFVQPLAHFLAGLEERHTLLVHRHVLAGARIAARARRPMLDGKRAKTAQFHAIPARQRCDDFIENGVHDVL